MLTVNGPCQSIGPWGWWRAVTKELFGKKDANRSVRGSQTKAMRVYLDGVATDGLPEEGAQDQKDKTDQRHDGLRRSERIFDDVADAESIFLDGHRALSARDGRLVEAQGKKQDSVDRHQRGQRHNAEGLVWRGLAPHPLRQPHPNRQHLWKSMQNQPSLRLRF